MLCWKPYFCCECVVHLLRKNIQCWQHMETLPNSVLMKLFESLKKLFSKKVFTSVSVMHASIWSSRLTTHLFWSPNVHFVTHLWSQCHLFLASFIHSSHRKVQQKWWNFCNTVEVYKQMQTNTTQNTLWSWRGGRRCYWWLIGRNSFLPRNSIPIPAFFAISSLSPINSIFRILTSETIPITI